MLHLLLLSVAFTGGYRIFLLLPKFKAETFDTFRANGVSRGAGQAGCALFDPAVAYRH
jgi:hypothetical protein